MVSSSTATAAGSAARSAAMVNKAFFQVVPTPDTSTPIGAGPLTIMPVLRCSYNPTTLSINGSTTWSGAEQAVSRDVPHQQHSHADPRTLTVELFFDDWEAMAGDVSRDVQTLYDWMRPRTYTTLGGQERRPPFVQFQWGVKRYFKAYVQSVKVTYDLFRQDGSPVRASATVTLKEALDETGRLSQNPTSGGRTGRRTRVVGAGDTLQSIANEEYGRPALWRGLALANEIDDPLALPSGARVLIPPRDQAVSLAGVEVEG